MVSKHPPQPQARLQGVTRRSLYNWRHQILILTPFVCCKITPHILCSKSGSCALPLQALLGLLFLFLLHRHFALIFRRREARYFSTGKDGYFVSEGFSRQLPLATAAHNWLTRPQRGRFGASLVPYPAFKNAHSLSQGRVWFHRCFLVRFFRGNPAGCRSRR